MPLGCARLILERTGQSAEVLGEVTGLNKYLMKIDVASRQIWFILQTGQLKLWNQGGEPWMK